MKDIKICVLGGDSRQLFSAHEMLKNNYDVSVFGLPCNDGVLKECSSLSSAMEGAKIVILPLPLTTDGIRLFCPLSDKDIKLEKIIEYITPMQIIAGGKMTVGFVDSVKSKNAQPFDYSNSERFSILNAIPTAEGAVAIAMNEIKTTLFGSECAVLGYGRIGKILSKTLRSLGADVTVFARKDSALAWAETEDCTAININNIQDNIAGKKLIFNTIPSIVLTKDILDKTEKDVAIIDLASAPGGVDTVYAKEIKRKVIFALSLPGKVAPETAGKIISDTILSYIKGENI